MTLKRSWLALAFWGLMMIAGMYALRAHHLSLRHIPLLIRQMVTHFGVYGPLVLMGLYLFRTVIIIIPSSMLNILAASIYGPWNGFLINLIGENVTAMIVFWVARLLGRADVIQAQSAWLKKMDGVINEHGFYSIFSLRVFFVPFDLVNVVGGVSAVRFRSFALATFFGLLPSIFALTFGPEVFQLKRSSLPIAVLIVVIYALLFSVRRHPSILKFLGEKV